MKRGASICFGLAVAGITSQSAQASDWTNAAADQNFNNAANWTGDIENENAVINIATPGTQPILGANQTIGPIDILIGTAGNTGRFDHTDGAGGTGDGNWMFVGQGIDGIGTYNLADTSGSGGILTGFAQGSGSMDVGGFSQNGRLLLGDGGTSNGTLNMNTSGVLNAKQGLGLIVATNGGDGTINLDHGTINTTQAWFGDNNAASSGTLNMSGGIINTTADLILGRVTGTGTATITGGTLNVGGALFLAEGTGPANAASGTLTVQTGGTVNSIGDVRVLSSGNNSGTLNISGGTLNLGPTGERWMIVGAYDSGSATVNVSSGNLNLLNNTDLRFNTQFNNTGTHVINQTGGSVTFYTDNGTTTVGSSGVLDMQRDGNTSSSSTYHLSGGTLTVSRIVTDEIIAERGSRIFNFNGGTLKPTGSTADFMNAGVVTRANVRNGGAVIDTNGFNVTIGHALEHSDIGGDNATDGGLTKSGGGTLTLSGANTYTGATSVSAGTLDLTGSLANTAVTVAGSATLALNGNIGGSLSVNSGGHLALAVAANSGSQVTRMITGSLTLTAGNVVDLTAAATPAVGTYVLATASGGISGTLTTANYNGITGTLAVNGNNLELTVSSSAYVAWTSSKTLTGANNGTTQDPESDDLENVLEFVLGGNPLASDPASIRPVQSDDGTYFVFTFNRADASLAEVTLTFEHSTSLTGWTSIAIPASATGIPVNITDNGATDQVVVKVLKGANTKLFGRLRAVK